MLFECHETGGHITSSRSEQLMSEEHQNPGKQEDFESRSEIEGRE